MRLFQRFICMKMEKRKVRKPMLNHKGNIIIGLDCGNYNIKTAGTCFPSGFAEVSEHDPFEDKLCYKGKYYVLTGTPLNIRDDKSKTDDFQILSMFGIAKELEHNHVSFGSVSKITLAVGLPPGKMSITSYKKNLEEYHKGLFEFSYNGQPAKIEVERVLVLPQCFSALMWQNHTEKMRSLHIHDSVLLSDFLDKEAQTILIDIGGGTVDVIRLEEGKMSADHYYSFNLGLRKCLTEIDRRIELTTGSAIGESLITQYVLGKRVRLSLDDELIINEHLDKYVDDLIIALSSNQIPLRNSYVILMGGNAELVYRSIHAQNKHKNIFGELDILTDLSANAKGYEGFARAYFDDEQ